MAMYNTFDEVDRFAEVLARIVKDRQSLSVPASGSLESESMCRDVSNILFAVSSGESPDKIADDLADDFLFCDDPQSKTKLLIEFGQQLPDSFDQLKRITTAVPGCMSEVYVLGRPSKEDPSRLELAGDSNAQIVRGLIAVLQKLLSGQPASSILEFDLEGFFRRIGLDQFITSQRRSGLAGMIRRIRKLAEGIVERNLTTGTR